MTTLASENFLLFLLIEKRTNPNNFFFFFFKWNTSSFPFVFGAYFGHTMRWILIEFLPRVTSPKETKKGILNSKKDKFG